MRGCANVGRWEEGTELCRVFMDQCQFKMDTCFIFSQCRLEQQENCADVDSERNDWWRWNGDSCDCHAKRVILSLWILWWLFRNNPWYLLDRFRSFLVLFLDDSDSCYEDKNDDLWTSPLLSVGLCSVFFDRTLWMSLTPMLFSLFFLFVLFLVVCLFVCVLDCLFYVHLGWRHRQRFCEHLLVDSSSQSVFAVIRSNSISVSTDHAPLADAFDNDDFPSEYVVWSFCFVFLVTSIPSSCFCFLIFSHLLSSQC